MIDFHCHILPGIDDGAADPLTSYRIINNGKEQGITKFIFTPHFYSSDSDIETFIEKRHNALFNLKQFYKDSGEDFPDYLLGAEVALTPETDSLENIEKLCISGTNLILVEFPYSMCGDWVKTCILNIMYNRGLTPVIAHIERYISFHGYKGIINDVLEENIPIQINGSAFLSFRTQRFVKKIYKKGTTLLLGSDTHNLTTRRYNLTSELKRAGKISKDFIAELEKNAVFCLEEYKILHSQI